MKAYICIGGPLDGVFATRKDFQRPFISMNTSSNFSLQSTSPTAQIPVTRHLAGRYEKYRDWYVKFNCGVRGNECTMVWIHRSLLKPGVKAS